jgi:hypothetical protein
MCTQEKKTEMGDTSTLGMSGSYNLYSAGQNAAILGSTPYIHEAVDLFSSNSPLIIIGDYGSSHGLNSFHAMKMIIDYLRETNKLTDNQQILVVHNDLATNDWKTLFEVLQEKKEYYGVASGKSFYEQCLPDNCLSIGYSSSSVHWLSRKPCNLTNHFLSTYLDDNDPDRLIFAQQAQLDFTHFLEHRSRELVQGGVLILVIPSVNPSEHGPSSTGTTMAAMAVLPIQILYECAKALLTPEELLDYTFPIHHRSFDDFLDHSLYARYSLQLIKAEQFTTENPWLEKLRQGTIKVDEYARARRLAIQSTSGSILEQVLVHNTQRDTIMNQFWAMCEDKIKQHLEPHSNQFRQTCLILKKS